MRLRWNVGSTGDGCRTHDLLGSHALGRADDNSDLVACMRSEEKQER